MNQKKFAELDQIIHRDYDNIAGLVVQKTVKQHMRHILADMPWKTLSMYFR